MYVSAKAMRMRKTRLLRPFCSNMPDTVPLHVFQLSHHTLRPMNEWIGHWTLFSVVGRVKTGMCLSHTSPGYTVFLIYIFKRYYSIRARFGSTYTKIGTIQRRLAWPLRKDDTQIREAFQIFYITFQSITILNKFL